MSAENWGGFEYKTSAEIQTHQEAFSSLISLTAGFLSEAGRVDKSPAMFLIKYRRWLSGKTGAEIVSLEELLDAINYAIKQDVSPTEKRTSTDYEWVGSLEEIETLIGDALALTKR